MYIDDLVKIDLSFVSITMIGSAYAMLTTFGNVALVCASSIGNLLSQVWDVSNDAMRTNDVRGIHSLSTHTLEVHLFLLFYC